MPEDTAASASDVNASDLLATIRDLVTLRKLQYMHVPQVYEKHVRFGVADDKRWAAWMIALDDATKAPDLTRFLSDEVEAARVRLIKLEAEEQANGYVIEPVDFPEGGGLWGSRVKDRPDITASGENQGWAVKHAREKLAAALAQEMGAPAVAEAPKVVKGKKGDKPVGLIDGAALDELANIVVEEARK